MYGSVNLTKICVLLAFSISSLLHSLSTCLKGKEEAADLIRAMGALNGKPAMCTVFINNAVCLCYCY